MFLSGESCGQRSLAGYSPWGHTESDVTERTRTSLIRVNSLVTDQEQGKTPGAGREEDDKNNIYRLYCSAQAGPTNSESPTPPGPLYVLF